MCAKEKLFIYANKSVYIWSASTLQSAENAFVPPNEREIYTKARTRNVDYKEQQCQYHDERTQIVHTACVSNRRSAK